MKEAKVKGHACYDEILQNALEDRQVHKDRMYIYGFQEQENGENWGIVRDRESYSR